MVNTQLLRYYIALNKDTTEQLAAHLSISRSALSARINNKRCFKLDEALKIAERYNLTIGQFRSIFVGGVENENRRSG